MEEQRRIRLERLLDEFDRLGIGLQVNCGKLRLYSIITHSTALEGSTVTAEENKVMFDDGLPPAGRSVVEQLMNLDLKRAYEAAEEVAAARTRLTLPLLKAFSSLVMRNTGDALSDAAWRWRPHVALFGFYVGVAAFIEIDVHVGGFPRFCVRVARILRD